MSSSIGGGGSAASPPTQSADPGGGSADLHRYRAGAGFGAPPPGVVLGWAVPPSLAAMPPWPPYGHAGAYAAGAATPSWQPGGPPAGQAAWGGIGQSLGTTLQLGLSVVNALLAGTMNALGGAAAMSQAALPGTRSGPHGCGCDSCGGYDCCDVLACSCCRPNVSGCC